MFGKHNIHIKGVWYTLYAMNGHTDATLTCMCMAKGLAAVCDIWELTTLLGCDWDLLSNHTYIGFTSYIQKLFGILYMPWMVIRMPPHTV